jgi:hypothetical protein
MTGAMQSIAPALRTKLSFSAFFIPYSLVGGFFWFSVSQFTAQAMADRGAWRHE